MVKMQPLKIMEDILTNRNIEKLSLFIISNFDVCSDLQYDKIIKYVLNTKDDINMIISIDLALNQIDFVYKPHNNEHKEIIEAVTNFVMEEL